MAAQAPTEAQEGGRPRTSPAFNGTSHAPSNAIETQQRPQSADGPRKQPSEQKQKGPAGGFDSTPIPRAAAGYTVRITFKRADKLPIADLATLSSDPYIVAELRTSLPTRHKEDPTLRFRTHTIWRSTQPQWDEDWIVAHVPATGFKLKLRIYDEDSSDHDDRLGNVHVHVDHIDANWQGFKDRAFPIRVRSGSKRAYLLRAFAVAARRVRHMSGTMVLGIEVLGKSEGSDGGRAYTVGRNYWCKHYSPLLGRITGTKSGQEDTDYRLPTNGSEQGEAVPQPVTLGPERPLDASEERRIGAQKVSNPELGENSATNGVLEKAMKKKQHVQDKRNKKKEQNQESGTKRYNFESNQIQLTGPVPQELYHRYVEFRPFIKSLYTKSGIRGNILNYALHHQHLQVYNFNRDTRYGVFDAPCRDMTLKFLELCHFDAGGRIFTYVITLDALLRFTETGKEFGIDMLSKHTMHSDREAYIAFSGEFFIRRLRHRSKASGESHSSDARGTPVAAEEPEASHPPAEIDGGPPQSAPPLDPSYYELVIDNDSGTYRPSAKQLPKLRSFLQQNLPGLKVSTLDCQADEKLMARLKDQQRDRKKKEQGSNRIIYTQINASESSISSSDEERLDRLAAQDREAQDRSQHGMQQTHKLGEAVAPLLGNHPHLRKTMGERPAEPDQRL